MTRTQARKVPVGLRKALLAVPMVAILVASPAPAGVPTTDGANLAQNIANNIMEAVAWAQEKGLMLMEMDLSSLMSKLQIQNQNNAIANMIVRNGRALQDIQNKKIAEQSMPADNACSTISSAEAGRQVDEIASERKMRRAAEFAALTKDLSGANERGRGALTGDTSRLQAQAAKDIVDECSTLQSVAAGDVNMDAPMATSLCMRGDLLTGDASVMTDDESAAMDVLNRLLAGPIPESDRVSPGVKGNQDRVQIARREALQSLAFGSLQEVSAWRQPATQGISPMVVLEEAVGAHYSPGELSKVANVNSDAKNDDMPSEVQRKMAQMQSLGLYINKEQLKSDLRRQALLAALLSIKVTPLEQ